MKRRDFVTSLAATMAGAAMPRRAESQVVIGLPRVRVNAIIRNAYVLTLDPALGDVANGDVHVRNGAIVAVGQNLQAPGAQVIDGRNTIVCPGFVETHWHMWNGILRGLVLDGPDWGYFPLQRLADAYTTYDHYTAVRFAATEALNAGITTVHNYSHGLRNMGDTDAEMQALVDAGIRARFGYGNFRGDQPFPYARADLGRVQREWIASGGADGLLSLGICSALGPTWEVDIETARRLGIGISAHGGGQNGDLPALARAGLLGADVQLIHMLNTPAAGIAAIAATNTMVSLAPFTEAIAPMGLPPVVDLVRGGVPLRNISLSVDVTAQSCADMFAMMRAIVGVARMQTVEQYAMVPRQAMEMATIGGARNLGLESSIGTLTPGKRADLVMVRTDALNMMPGAGLDPTRLLVLCAQPQNVDTVLVDGRIVKRGGQMQGTDVTDVVRQASTSLASIRERAKLPPLDLKA
jgi:cytosine/adenosine deaminase-related metal-dependent hydrolase